MLNNYLYNSTNVCVNTYQNQIYINKTLIKKSTEILV